jgi:hypothetical protein
MTTWGRRWPLIVALSIVATTLGPVGPAMAGCGDTWTTSEDDVFLAYWEDVAIADATHAWAVGSDDHEHLAIASWNGSTWSDDTPSLFPSNSNSHLTSVWADGPNDVWAVGDRYRPGTHTLTGLILHRTSTGWTVDRMVSPGRSARFGSVWGDSSGDLWAVGETRAGGRFVGITYQRVDTDWVRVSFPRADGVERYLHGVSGSGPKDVWAVGDESTATAVFTHPIAYRWTGTAWHRAPLPVLPHPELVASLWDVAAVDATHAWAVGYFAGMRRMLLERWDGSSWERVYIPDQTGRETLWGVTATSSTNALAVGYQNGSTPAIRMWNGHRWSAATVSASGGTLAGVDALPGAGAFAVGWRDYDLIVATCD